MEIDNPSAIDVEYLGATATLIGAIIGGILSAGAGAVIEAFREKRKEDRARRLLTTAICDDLNHSVGLYDKLAEDWQKEKIIFFTTINELRDSRQTYINNKDWINIFDDGDLRRSIFTYYLQSADCMTQLENLQRQKYDLENRYNQSLSQIKLSNPDLSEEDAKARVTNSMKGESLEYSKIDGLISDLMIKLLKFKDVARDISGSLKKL